MNKATRTKSILWIVFLTIFIDMLGIGVLIPVFPLLVIKNSQFSVIPNSWTEQQALIMAGWLLASYSLAQFIATPLLGQLADRWGRKKLLSVSIAGTALSYCLFAYAIYQRSIPLMFISRLIDGVSGGNIAIAQAVIGDISAPQVRAKNFGLIGVAVGVGFVAGPFIGGKLSDPQLISWFNATTPFIFTAGLSLINTLLVLKFLPETLKSKLPQRLDSLKAVHNLLALGTNLKLRKLIYSLFLFNSGFTFFTTFWGVVLQQQFGFKQGQVGDFFAYSGIMIIVAQGLVVRRLAGKVADYKVLTLALPGMAICLLANGLIPATQANWIYWVPPFLAIFTALTKAFATAMIARLSEEGKLGAAMGANSSSNALAQALPAIIAGYLATNEARLPVVLGALVTVMAAGLFIINRRFWHGRV